MLFRRESFFAKWKYYILNEYTTPRVKIGIVSANGSAKQRSGKETHKTYWQHFFKCYYYEHLILNCGVGNRINGLLNVLCLIGEIAVMHQRKCTERNNQIHYHQNHVSPLSNNSRHLCFMCIKRSGIIALNALPGAIIIDPYEGEYQKKEKIKAHSLGGLKGVEH